MTAWVLLSGLVGTVLGALVGVVGKYFFDVRAGRKARLLDEKIKYAVAFLEAADRVARTSDSRINAIRSLENTRDAGQATPDQLERARTAYDARVEEGVTAWMDAQKAHTAIRLLMPEAASAADIYVELCGHAGYPDTGKEERKRARDTVEAALRRSVGI